MVTPDFNQLRGIVYALHFIQQHPVIILIRLQVNKKSSIHTPIISIYSQLFDFQGLKQLIVILSAFFR